MKEYRSFQLDLDTRDDKQRTVAASLSSEEPVLRVYGREVLEHTAEAVDLSREPFPLIVSHDNSDTPVGIVENVRIVGRKLRGLLRFGKGNIASEKWKDVKDGILRNLSIGYQILEGHSDGEFYRATRWQLAEVSLVAVPADPTVGIGRSEDFMEQQHEDKRRPRAIKREARQEAIEELKEIRALGKVHGFEAEADRAIDNDWPLERFREFVMDKLTEQNLKPIETPGSVVLGLNDRQAQSFSFVRFYNALANPQDQNAQRNAGFELEVCRAYADRIGSRGEGFRIPPEALVGRDLTVGTDAGGGYTVGTDMRPQDFIDALRNKMVCVQAGATLLSGLVGDIAIPRLSAGATAYWLAEGDSTTESTPTFAQVSMTPKTVAAYCDISRKLLVQSSLDIENLVRDMQAADVSVELDRAALHGSGSSNQPTGIASTSGIGSVAGGTNGATPTYAHVLELEEDVAVANAETSGMAYISNPKVRRVLKGVYTNATYGEIPVWAPGPEVGVGMMNGYPAFATNQAASDLAKGTSTGVCSAIFFGNWSELLIGLWTGLDVIVDPYTNAPSGAVRIVTLQDLDINVKNAASFSAMLDALTA